MSDRMLRAPEVGERTGLSRITIWRKVRAGTFPPPIELGPNTIGWLESVIDDWLANRPQRTYGAKQPYGAEEAVAS